MANEFVQTMADARVDADSLEKFINGSEDEMVLTRLSAQYPTLQKALKEMLENGGIADRFKTLADLQTSDLVDGDYALVADDTDDKNGIYVKDGGAWVKSKYDMKQIAEGSVYDFFKKSEYDAVWQPGSFLSNGDYWDTPSRARLAVKKHSAPNTYV